MQESSGSLDIRVVGEGDKQGRELLEPGFQMWGRNGRECLRGGARYGEPPTEELEKISCYYQCTDQRWFWFTVHVGRYGGDEYAGATWRVRNPPFDPLESRTERDRMVRRDLHRSHRRTWIAVGDPNG